MAKRVHSAYDVKVWLRGKSVRWARTISVRCAIRAFPLVFDQSTADQLDAFAGIFSIWFTDKWAPPKSKNYSRRIFQRRTAKAFTDHVLFHASAAIIHSKNTPAMATENTINSFNALLRDGEFHATVNSKFSEEELFNQYIDEVQFDIDFLERQKMKTFATVDLIDLPLWNVSTPDWLEDAKKENFLNEPKAKIWIDWLERRQAGSESSFGLPIDEDRGVGLKMVSQDDKFWDRNYDLILHDIYGWLGEAVKDSISHAEPQNPLAPLFRTDADGRIDLDAQAGVQSIQADEEARDRHAEAVSATERALSACSGNSAAATRFDVIRYSEALGQRIEELKPGQIIQRGESLRQELILRMRGDPDSNLPPIPDTAILALKSLVTAHNILVGLDPELSRRDDAIFGPDAIKYQISVAQARDVARSAIEEDIITSSANDIIDGAASVAPTVPDSNNRLSRQLTETVRNFGRKIASILSANMKNVIWGGGAISVSSAAISAGLAVGSVLGMGSGVGAAAGATLGAIAGNYKIAQWALKNSEYFKGIFADNPTMLSLINKIIDELKKLPVN